MSESRGQRCTFLLKYSYQGCSFAIKQKIPDMAVNGSGIRDTDRVLKISPSTVIKELKKKESGLVFINEKIAEIEPNQTIVRLFQWEEVEAEADEMGRFVKSKTERRWLGHAIDHGARENLSVGSSRAEI